MLRPRATLPVLSLLVIAVLAACRSAPVEPPAAPTIARATPAVPAPAGTAQATDARTTLPTRTASPTVGPEGYRLRFWSEADAVAAISEVQNLRPALEDLPPEEERERRAYDDTLRREATARFPQLLTRYSNGLDGQQVIRVFAAQLAGALNTGSVLSGDLGPWIAARGFALKTVLPASNLFGDQQPAVVVQIQTLLGSDPELPSGSFLLVIRGTRAGEYEVAPVREELRGFGGWPGYGGETVDIADPLGLGRPQIVSIATGCGHNGCSAELAVYTWLGNTFVDAAESLPWLFFFGPSEQVAASAFSFAPRDARVAQAVLATEQTWNRVGEDCAWYAQQTRYEWDGERYVAAGKQDVPFAAGQSLACRAGWALLAAGRGRFDQAIPAVEAVLAQWPAQLDDVWGPASQDYIRYLLGTWYGLTGRPAEAQSTLGRVRDEPEQPRFTMAPSLAGAYLERYHSQADLYSACVAVRQLAWDEAQSLEALHTDPLIVSADDMKRSWGFADPEWQFASDFGLALDVGNLCHPLRSLEQSVAAAPPDSAADWDGWFRERGMDAAAVAEADVTGDGTRERLVVWRDLVADKRWLYALVPEDAGWSAVRIAEVGHDDVPFELRERLLPGGADLAAMLVLSGELLFVFRLVRDPDWRAETLLSTSNVQDYTIVPGSDGAEIMVTTLKDGKAELRRYAWTDATGQYERVPTAEETQREAQRNELAAIEQLMFGAGEFSAAAPRLQALLAGGQLGPEAAYVQYLLGLAYELTGDEVRAVETYWALAQQYPESLYVLVVRRKLERVVP